jgi:HEPN domain-containing protein
MSDEAAHWLRYAEENRQTAELCIKNHLYNPAIQNAQQAVEKSLKALCLHAELPIRKTHSIGGLWRDLLRENIDCGLNDESCDLLDAVYLPSKYPLGSALPEFDPDPVIARQCINIACQILQFATKFVGECGQE